MFLRIEKIAAKKMIGKCVEMSFANNKTASLWKSFMPLRKQIKHAVDSLLYSLQEYKNIKEYNEITYTIPFTKWALIEVSDYSEILPGMQKFDLSEGLYAIFLHKGSSIQFAKTFKYIFEEWLPESGYSLDSRPHFEILGDKYINNSSKSEEEIWIPIKKT